MYPRAGGPRMTPRFSLLAAGCLLAVVAVVGGCKPGSDVVSPVKGRVTFRGIPLPGGMIVFAPDAARGTRSTIAQAEIQTDGSYALKSKDALGVLAGHYR